MNEKVTLTMKCEDCGHIQEVTGFKTEDGSTYFGSSYNWCDACGDGKPVPMISSEYEPREVSKEEARALIIHKLQEAIAAVDEFNRLWDDAIEIHVKPNIVKHR